MTLTDPSVTTAADHATVNRMADPVGVLEIAARLGVKDRTVHKWLQLGQMPPGDYDKVNGSRAWEWKTILRWAGEKGRVRTAELAAEYRAMFGADPAAVRNAGRPLKVTSGQIEEIATTDTPASVIAARLGVSEAYVWKVRRLRRRDATPPKPAARKTTAKKTRKSAAAEPGPLKRPAKKTAATKRK